MDVICKDSWVTYWGWMSYMFMGVQMVFPHINDKNYIQLVCIYNMDKK